MKGNKTMKAIKCEHCGGDEFIEKSGYRICKYCKSKFQIAKEERLQPGSHIAINDDVERLLQKCRENPRRAHKYAALILDIDPTNIEARMYL